MTDESTPKAWALGLPAGPPLKDSPERLIAEAGGSDAASNPNYKLEVYRTNDPTSGGKRLGGASEGSTYVVCVASVSATGTNAPDHPDMPHSY